jgi:hypothetical protein
MWPALKKIGVGVCMTFLMLGVLLGGCMGLTWHQRIPSVVSLEARFQKLPDNDQELANWIRAQPNVFRAVSVARLDPDRKRVVIWIPVSFHLWRHTAVPDLDSNIGRFGYLEPDGPFRPSVEDSLPNVTCSAEP